MSIDFLVVGGGIAGTSAGAALSGLGRVALVEAEAALGFHASGRSAALYDPAYGSAPTLALTRATGEGLRRGGYLTERGILLVGTRADAAAFDREMAQMGLEPVTQAGMLARVSVLNPAVVTRGGWQPQAFDIDTDRLIQDGARAIRSAGGTVRTAAPVISIRRTGAGWEVETPVEVIEARVLVNAAGAWADPVAVLAGLPPLGLIPYRRSMARIPAPGGHDCRAWPMLLGPGESWYAKPDAGALVVSPAEALATTAHDAFADDLVLAEGLARYEACVTEPVTRLFASWAGLRTFAPDRNLVLGPDPRDPAFVWVAGQGGYGFQTALAAAALVADLIEGRAPALDAATVAALRPDRLR